MVKYPAPLESPNKTVFSGIKKFYSPQQIIGKKVLFLANLEPRQMKFGLSEGMILCSASPDGSRVHLTTIDDDNDVNVGNLVT